MSNGVRRVSATAFFILSALFTVPSFGQYQTPTVNGTIAVGEYAHSSGNWSVTWDATYLYVAKANLTASNYKFSIYLDTDPLATPGGGANANGNLVGPGESGPGGAANDPVTVNLPFRADTRIYVDSNTNGSTMQNRNGSGGWTTASTTGSGFLVASNGTTREVRIPWSVVQGGAIPATFNWLGMEIGATPNPGSVSTIIDPMPPANPTGTTTPAEHRYFFEITSSANGAATNPFSVRNVTWRVTTNTNSGTNSLRDAITNSNADATSNRRYVTFALTNTTITLTTALPAVTKKTSIDGTSQNGGTTPAVSVIGFDTSNATDIGIELNATTGSVVRGLVLANHFEGVFVNGGTSNTVAGNYIGTNAAGTASSSNNIGIYLSGATGTTIGGTAAADKNVVSGSLTTGISINNAASTAVKSNYVGTNAAGSAAIPNSKGIEVINSTGTVLGSAGAGNVISGNTAGVAMNTSDVAINSNLIGVGADGTTAIGNSGTAIDNNSGTAIVIGSVAAPNTIANNGNGISVVNNGGLLIRGNSMYANISSAISIGNVVQPAPTVNYAYVSGSTLSVNFDLTSNSTSAPTQSLQLDVYTADNTNSVAQGRTYRATSPCYTGSSLSGQLWTVGSGFTAGDKVVFIATAYANASCASTSVGDGSSQFTSVITTTAPAATTTLIGSSDGFPYGGASITFTATVSSSLANITGTVSFTDNGNPIAGCTAVTVTADQAQCNTSLPATGNHTIVGTYSGDNIHDTSTSPNFIQSVNGRLFTGPGLFSNTALWTGNSLPIATEAFIIKDAATFDSAAPGTAYGSMTLGDGGVPGSVTFAPGNPVTLRVTDVSSAVAGGAIDMTDGGTLRIDGTWNGGFTFTAGTGTVQFGGTNQTLPALSYKNLTIIGTGATSASGFNISGAFTVNSGASFSDGTSNTIIISDGSIANSGTLTFYNLSIPAGTSTSATGSFNVGNNLTVDGTLSPSAATVIGGGGTLTGTGTAKVTSTSASGLSSQYTLNRTLTNLTIEFAGSASQSVDGTTYNNLTLNNAAGASLAGNATVNGTLSLVSGVLATGAQSITAANNVTAGSGWINGTLTRAITTGTFSYPIGTASSPAPVSATFNTVSVNGNVAIGATAGEHPQVAGSGVNPSRDANVYWNYQDVSATYASYDITFTFGSLVDGGAAPTSFVLRGFNNANTTWFNVPATPGATTISASGLPGTAGPVINFVAGNQLIDHYDVSATTPQTSTVAFNTTVTAQDILNLTVADDSSTVVTMSSSSPNVQFDSNGDTTFGDNTKTLTNGTFTISTKDDLAEVFTITATDANTKTGTSGTITITGNATTTVLNSSVNPSYLGQSVTFTAAVTSGGPMPTGTVTFKDGAATLGTTSLVGGSATFTTSALALGNHQITAFYNADANSYASTSNTLSQDVLATPIFNGPGLFSDTTKWSIGDVPPATAPFIIKDAATFDNAAPVRAYGAMTLGDSGTAGSVIFQAGNTVILQVTDITSVVAGGAIDMSAGGTLRIDGTMSSTDLAFTAGTGTVQLSTNSGSLPASFTFHNITIVGAPDGISVSTLNGAFTVNSGASFTNGNATFQGGSITNNGTLSFNTLTIDDGGTGTTTADSSFAVSNSFVVRGTFAPVAAAVISGAGTVSGAGSTHVIRVTGTASPNSLASQYSLNRTLTALTVAFVGTAAQSLDAGTYSDLTVNNGAGVTATGAVTVTGSLNVGAGIITAASGFTVSSTSVSAISATSGWIHGDLTRGIDAGTNTYVFPVGTATVYTPVTLGFSALGVAGTAHVSPTGGDHADLANAGINPARDANVYWLVGGDVTRTADVTFAFNGLVDGGANANTFVLRTKLGANWSNVPATPSVMSISANGVSIDQSGQTFATGNQLIDHYVVAATSPQPVGSTFNTTVTAQDILNLLVSDDSTTVVTMSSNTGNAQFDSNGNATFGDVTKTLTNGTFTIATKDDVVETVTLIATDANTKTGSSSGISIEGTLSTPLLFSATASAPTQVALTWGAVGGATSYEIYRQASIGGGFVPYDTTTNTTYLDNGVVANTTYLYKVRAAAGGGSFSGFTAVDPATTVIFTDASLTGVKVKAVHFTELRTAVNAMRAAAGLTAATFTNTLTPQVTKVKALDLTELRAALDPARSTLGLTAVTYADPTVTAQSTTIKKAHITDLREGVQ